MRAVEYHTHEPDALKGMVAGAIGGAAGVIMMTMFQNVMSSAMQAMQNDEGSDSSNSESESNPPATEKAAEKISEGALSHHLSERERHVAGQAVHYGFGLTSGAAYGVVSEYVPVATFGAGAGFGTALMIGADEMAVPAAGLSAPPTKQPPSTHLMALLSHLVYGTTTEVVRSTVRSALDTMTDGDSRHRMHDAPDLLVSTRRQVV